MPFLYLLIIYSTNFFLFCNTQKDGNKIAILFNNNFNLNNNLQLVFR